MKETLNKIIDKFKDRIVAIALAVILIIGFICGFAFKGCVGIKATDYNNLLSENDTLNSQIDQLNKEYSDYKAKMQPYEEQQAADVKAEEERKAAEEKAKKEAEQKAAEEKAAKEAEEKRQQEEKAKEGTFGMNAKEFVQSFNMNSAALGSSVTATVPTSTDNFIDIGTSSNNVSLSLSMQRGYVSDVYVNGEGDGSSASAVDQIYSMVAAAQALDSSLETSDISNFLTVLISNAPKNGDNYTQKKNGITYTVSAMPGSTVLLINKR